MVSSKGSLEGSFRRVEGLSVGAGFRVYSVKGVVQGAFKGTTRSSW